jgi:sialate O-acetylesterase
MVREINLNGIWKFSIMHQEKWKNAEFDDSSWDELSTPGNWESQGYNGYDGYGFYRKKVTIPEELGESQLFLGLGYINDVDEVYLNGELIGSSGSFPPEYETAWKANRSYLIPESLIIKGGVNIIAVKVFDLHHDGGIIKGKLGIYRQEYPIKPIINLVGVWKFSTDSNDSFLEINYDDESWNDIIVPGRWEDQGYRGYDGCAWYRRRFEVNNSFNEETLVLLAGKIDDFDQIFINGEWVGESGPNGGFISCEGIPNSKYNKVDRAYIFPASLLKKGTNIIAIRVIDESGSGGIYEGPVGIIGQSEFINYWKKRSNNMRNKRNSDW